jgi:hypothetical protein
MTSSLTRLARDAVMDVPVVAKKGLASAVIAVCLVVQTYAIIRPSGARWYPFLSYPMYSSSRPAGVTYRVQELWARTCDSHPRRWQLGPAMLGYQDDHFLTGMSATAGDRPAARNYRARLSELARTRITPRPCVLEVWQRTIPTTAAGVNVADLRYPRRTLLREWRVDDPGALHAFRAP